MRTLRLAAFVAALTTIILNALHGYKASAVFEYAVLFATFQAALDIAKCTLVGVAADAVRQRKLAIAVLALMLFPLLFANSVWNAVSQVMLVRDQGMATAVTDRDRRTHLEALRKRLASELATMQANPTFKATAACALPKSTEAKAFCATVARTKADLDRIAGQLGTTTAADPEPHVTIMASKFGLPTQDVRFLLAVVPVVLAELVGSLGFYLASLRTDAPKAIRSAPRAFWWSRRRLTAADPPNTSTVLPERSAMASETPAPAPTASTGPRIIWSTSQ